MELKQSTEKIKMNTPVWFPLITTEIGLLLLVQSFMEEFPNIQATVYSRSRDEGECINIAPAGQPGRLVFSRFQPHIISKEKYYLIFSASDQTGEFRGLKCQYSDYANPVICQKFIVEFVQYLKRRFLASTPDTQPARV